MLVPWNPLERDLTVFATELWIGTKDQNFAICNISLKPLHSPPPPLHFPPPPLHSPPPPLHSLPPSPGVQQQGADRAIGRRQRRLFFSIHFRASLPDDEDHVDPRHERDVPGLVGHQRRLSQGLESRRHRKQTNRIEVRSKIAWNLAFTKVKKFSCHKTIFF